MHLRRAHSIPPRCEKYLPFLPRLKGCLPVLDARMRASLFSAVAFCFLELQPVVGPGKGSGIIPQASDTKL